MENETKEIESNVMVKCLVKNRGRYIDIPQGRVGVVWTNGTRFLEWFRTIEGARFKVHNLVKVNAKSIRIVYGRVRIYDKGTHVVNTGEFVPKR